MDGEATAAEARRLRVEEQLVEEQLSVRQIQQRLGVGKDRVQVRITTDALSSTSRKVESCTGGSKG
jgi:Trp operon repressor